ncbi:MAG: hypothetical protein M3N93_10480 [Acidobacteriota bacterium]|nr:hypothetical protein [Acidobacteriota bacterium]
MKSDSEAATHTYLAWGLVIRSAIPLPEATALANGIPYQATILVGTITRDHEDWKATACFVETRHSGYLLRVPGIARFRVSNGSEITIEPELKPDWEAVRLFLLGPVFAALLYQRRLLPLHASAIATNRGGVIFAGGSGVGKSALAAAFNVNGYEVLADEICAVDCSSGEGMVRPGIPRLLLWPDVIRQLGLTAQDIRSVRAGLNKQHVRVHETRGSLRIHAIYVISVRPSGNFGVAAVEGAEKLRALTDILHGGRFLSSMTSLPDHFALLTSLARTTPVSKMTRPMVCELKEVAELLERDFKK